MRFAVVAAIVVDAVVASACGAPFSVATLAIFFGVRGFLIVVLVTAFLIVSFAIGVSFGQK